MEIGRMCLTVHDYYIYMRKWILLLEIWDWTFFMIALNKEIRFEVRQF
jgi:hypothetical protein